MKRYLLAAVLVLGVAGGILVWALRGEDEGGGDATRVPASAGDAGVGAVTTGPAGRRWTPSRETPVLPGTDAAVRSSVEPEDTRTKVDARAAVRDATRGCATRVSGSEEARVRVRYTMRVAGGEASASGVEVVEADEAADPMAACVAEKLEDAMWSTSLPDGITTVEEVITVGELR